MAKRAKVIANEDMVATAPPRAFNTTRRYNNNNNNNNPSVTLTADNGRDAPLVAVKNHTSNDSAPQNYALRRRKATGDRPAPTTTTAEDVGNAAFINSRQLACSGTWPALLDAQLPRVAPSSNGLRLASLFCGCGGVDLGFRSAGYVLAFATDYAPRACESFAFNLGHEPRCADIRELHAVDTGPVDVLTGGFPCVTFSMAGRRAGVTDDLNGKLYLEMCRLIDEIKPRYFVAENVRGMLSANRGNAVKLVLAAFLRLGYRTTYEAVNMAEHGVPQTRQRVIFVGVRLDQWRGAFRFPEKTHRLIEDRKARRVLPVAISLRDALAGLGEPGETIHELWHADSYRNHHTRVSSVAGSRPRRPDQPAHSQTASNPNVVVVGARNDDFANKVVNARRTSPSVVASAPPECLLANHEPNNAAVSPSYSTSAPRARADRPSPTAVSHSANVQPIIASGVLRAVNVFEQSRCLPHIVAHIRSSPSAPSPAPTVISESAPLAVVLGGVRRMSVRECARVQSFPDWFEFKGSMSDCYRQVGNAVPPLYAKRLAAAIVAYDAREVIR